MIWRSSINSFYKSLTIRQAVDTGVILVIALLITDYFIHVQGLYIASIITLILVLIIPAVFYPIAFIWFGLAGIMGFIISRIILSVVYFVIVCPIGYIRRISGRDGLHLMSFKKFNCSVFKIRDIEFDAKDIEHPY